MNQPIRAALYFRSTTSSESADDQLATLLQAATARGWTVVANATDQPTRTVSMRPDRPGIDALLHAAARHEIDVLIVRSLNDLANTLPALVRVVNELRDHGIELVACDDGLETTVPAGEAAFSTFAALATFEREQIRERARSSLQLARRAGVRLGRPTNVNPAVHAAIRALHERGTPIRGIARQLRVGYQTIYRALQGTTAPTTPRPARNSDNGIGAPVRLPERVRNRVPA